MSMTSRFPVVALAEVAEINPRRPRELSELPDEHLVSFVPMTAVDQNSGTIASPEPRRFGDVKKGFTYFAERDVIFAKITPCMQNGKSAIAHELFNQLGFGSTEFHVIRADESKIIPEWIWHFVRQRWFRIEGTRHFRGAVGQQRVPDEYLANAQIPLPSIEEQRRIVGRIKECFSRADEIESNDIQIGLETGAVFPSILNQRFKELSTTSEVLPLESVVEIRGGQSLPKGTSIDTGKTSALLIKVGDMNAEGNERTILRSRAFLPMDEAGRGLIQEGAVIFPKRGGAIATNKKRILGRPALLDPNLMAVIAKPDRMRDTFLYYWCQTLDLNQLSNGGVIPQLNRKDLAPLPVPLPDLEAQGRVVAELEECEAACAELRSHCLDSQEERKLLRESILRKAFAGEL